MREDLMFDEQDSDVLESVPRLGGGGNPMFGLCPNITKDGLYVVALTGRDNKPIDYTREKTFEEMISWYDAVLDMVKASKNNFEEVAGDREKRN